MLTIQPNFTTHSNNRLSFKSGYSVDTEEDKKFQEKTRFYEDQTQDFDNMINDTKTPEYMKKVFQGFKVASAGLFEGWLVMWGASKGSRFIKNGVLKGLNSKVVKEFKEIIKPLSKGLQSARKTISTAITDGATQFKNSEFLKKVNDNFIGKQIVNVFKFIGKSIAAVGSMVKSGYNAIASHFKGKSASEIYDKAAKVTGTTLGVGAGAAGAYTATLKPEKPETNNNINNEVDNDYYYTDEPVDYKPNRSSRNVDLDREYQEEMEKLEAGE